MNFSGVETTTVAVQDVALANTKSAMSIARSGHRRDLLEFVNDTRKATEGCLSNKVAKGSRDDTYETLKCILNYVDWVLGSELGPQINANVQSNKNWPFRPKLTNKPQLRRLKHAKYDSI